MTFTMANVKYQYNLCFNFYLGSRDFSFLTLFINSFQKILLVCRLNIKSSKKMVLEGRNANTLGMNPKFLYFNFHDSSLLAAAISSDFFFSCPLFDSF